MLESKQWEHNCREKAINASTHLGHVVCAGCCMCACLSVHVGVVAASLRGVCAVTRSWVMHSPIHMHGTRVG